MSLANLGDKIKRYYKFSNKELLSIAITTIVIAFIISFRDWGPGDPVNIHLGLINFFNSILIVLLSLLLVESAVRIAALSFGFQAEYEPFTIGLFISIVITFVSRGFVWFFMPNGFKLEPLTAHRLGHHRYEVDYFTLGMISLFAPIMHIALAIFFKAVYIAAPNAILLKAFHLNTLMAIYQILPIPPLAGSKVFFGSRMLYAFSFIGVIVASVFLYSNLPSWLSILGALVIALICWILYYIFFEKDFWRGPHPK